MRALLTALALWALAPAPAAALADPAAICDAAARIGAREIGAPEQVLRALTRTETGRARGGVLQPWPWTVNMEGAGHWFPDRDEAQAFVEKHMARGARSFDVGCFQINYRWHGDAFDSVTQMFDPAENARYAAKFLVDLHGEGGGWEAAAGRYHSRTPKFANKYKARFRRILAALSGDVDDDLAVRLAAAPPPRAPVIHAGDGSLFAAPRVTVGRPRHPGGVALSGFSTSTGLLRPARPLFE